VEREKYRIRYKADVDPELQRPDEEGNHTDMEDADEKR
jgi:hypothetical protein